MQPEIKSDDGLLAESVPMMFRVGFGGRPSSRIEGTGRLKAPEIGGSLQVSAKSGNPVSSRNSRRCMAAPNACRPSVLAASLAHLFRPSGRGIPVIWESASRT